MVVYFTGTGNSRYVARKIAEQTADQTVSANDFTKKDEGYVFTNTRPLVFVLPVYVSAPPLVFMDFLRKSKFAGNRKAYFIMTCAGGMGGSPAYCQKLSAELGLEYMGTASVRMPQNYIAFFTTKDADTNRGTLEVSAPVIGELARLVAAQEAFPDPQMKRWEYISTEMILGMYYKWFISAKGFKAGDTCIGCGICKTVCPLDNIRLADGKPVWGDRCTHCMACINACPKDAIEYGKKTRGKIRYRGPERTERH